MSEPSQSRPTQNLVTELIGQFSGAGFAADRSLGAVGPGVSPPQLPRHCLRTCLHGDPDQLQARGCPWLRAAVAGQLDQNHLAAGKCPRGFRAIGQTFRSNGSSGFLLAIEGVSGALSEGGTAASAYEQVSDELASLSQALERVGQLLDENEGLADEVLRNYEQLNLIFDFTQQVMSFTEVDAIEKALLGQLSGLLAAQTWLVIGPEGGCRCYEASQGELIPTGDAFVLNEQMAAEIEALRRSRTVSVHTSPTARVLLAPLVRLDDQVDMVLALRPLDAHEFTAGDTLMIESLLAFGGQIISNAEIHARLHRMSLESTRALVAAIDKKDHYTCGHSERVGLLAKLTGQRLGVPADKLLILEMSGLLHDVGKIGIPEAILCKPGKLTDEEYDVIKKHPRMGYEILKPIASFGGVLDGVLYHHENPDGSGYPEGLSAAQIPLFARIIHVIDVFDALTSTRSYRVKYSFEQACEIVRQEAGERLDADVAATFLEALPAFRAAHPEAFGLVCSREEEVHHVET